MAKVFNIQINNEKTVKPTTAQVHGIEVDTEQMAARQIIILLKLIRKTTLKTLQSAIGFLQFVCKCVRPGRTFLRRLISLCKGASRPNHHIRISKEPQKDLSAWAVFLDKYNGISLLSKQIWLNSTHLELFTDGTSTIGFGVVFKGKCCSQTFDKQIHYT